MAKSMLNSNRFQAIDYLIPLPLFPDKEHKRGYNQAEVVASVLAVAARAPVIRGMVRCRETAPQASRDEGARRANIAGAFAWDGVPLRSASLWLVDDVLTTGATAEAASAVLLEGGARCVSAVVMARVL